MVDPTPTPETHNCSKIYKESFNLFWTKVVYLQCLSFILPHTLLITHFFVESTFVTIIYSQNKLYLIKIVIKMTKTDCILVYS